MVGCVRASPEAPDFVLTGYANLAQFTTMIGVIGGDNSNSKRDYHYEKSTRIPRNKIHPVKRNNQIWLTAVEIAQALGYKNLMLLLRFMIVTQTSSATI